MIDLSEFELLGTKCVVNISHKAEVKGLTVLSTNPRTWRIKPEAYMGVVEKSGPDCQVVKAGDRVVVERWEFKQADVDDERLLIDESQVLVVQHPEKKGWGPEVPTMGVVVLKLKSDLPKTQLTLPDEFVKNERKKNLLYCGRVTDTASKTVKVGQVCWVERRERHQFRTADGRLMFINCQDSWGEYPIWMVGKKTEGRN